MRCKIEVMSVYNFKVVIQCSIGTTNRVSERQNEGIFYLVFDFLFFTTSQVLGSIMGDPSCIGPPFQVMISIE